MAKDKSSSLIDDKNKKYKLFAVARLDDPNIKPICAFFQSAAGCRNGATCKFAHEVSNTTATTHYVKSANAAVVNIPKTLSTPSNNNDKRLSNKVVVSTAASITSVISSESSDSDSSEEEPQDNKAVPVSMGKNKAGNKRKSNGELFGQNKKKQSIGNSTADDDDNPFALVPNKIETLKPKTEEDLRENTEEETNAPDFRALAVTAATPGVSTTTPASKQKKKQKEPKPQQEDRQTDIRALTSSLPVSLFFKEKKVSTPSQEKDKVVKDNESVDDEALENGNANQVTRVVGRFGVLPTSHPDGMKWKDLVIKTQSHQRYVKLSAKKDEVWIKAKPYGPWCAKFPQAIAIDCEMCETKDPMTEKKDGKALCRFSVVNAVDPREVLIDTLVKPEWPVTNYRSWINGIYESDLQNVQFTLKHAQEFMKALCSDETVILGHSLHNDLEALKMEHDCLVDSSYLFPVKNADRSAVCSLRDIALHTLKKAMPIKHDSVNDARVALEAIELYRAQNGHVEPVERILIKPEGTKLLVHRIAQGAVTEIHIANMFLHLTNIKPVSVEQLDFSGGLGKTLVSFPSSQHANLAFKTLEGVTDYDKGNHAQKKVSLKNKDYVRVRKMVPDHKGAQKELIKF